MPLGVKLALGAQALALAWGIHKRAKVGAVVSGASLLGMYLTWQAESAMVAKAAADAKILRLV